MEKIYCRQLYECNIKIDPISSEKNEKILLLVKNPLLKSIHKMLFKHYGYKVKSTSNAKYLCNYLQTYRPALVVLDMEIKDVLCQKIADLFRKEKIPVLLIITTEDDCDICKYLEPKRCDYVDTLTDDLSLIIKKAERLMKG